MQHDIREHKVGIILIFDWNDHYKQGGMSGIPDHYKNTNEWTHSILQQYISDNDSIIDIGCGDLQLWNNKLPKKYIGIDLSEEIIALNKNRYPETTFIASSSSINLDLKSNIVTCFNMLFHIMDDEEYIDTLFNIKLYAQKYAIIFEWKHNVFDKGYIHRIIEAIVRYKKTGVISFKPITNDGGYQQYRNFPKIAKRIFEPQFRLIEIYTNDILPDSAIYIWKRITY